MLKLNLKIETLLIFFAGIFLFTYGLFDHEFIQFESRFGLFAQEMLRNGLSFFPTTYNRPYPDYPSAQTIFIYLFSLLTGKVSIYTAVLPTALVAALTLSLTYLIAAKQSHLWGFYAVVFELFTYEFFTSARSVALDPFITAITLICFYLAYSSSSVVSRKTFYWLIAGFIAGFLLRGPIGFIIPAGVVCGYYALEQDFKTLLRMAGLALAALVFCMLLLLGAAFIQGGWHFVKAVIQMQISGRMADTETMPFFYFVFACINYAITFPIAVIVVGFFFPQLLKKELPEDLRLVRHAALWTFIIIAGLSIPGAKKIRYILPITPAISFIAAYLFANASLQKPLVYLRFIITKFCYVFPFLGLAIVPACIITAHIKSLVVNAHYFSAAVLFILEGLAVIYTNKKLKRTPYFTPAIIAMGLATFITLNIFIVEPINVSLNRVQPFVEQITAKRLPAQQIVFYKIGPDAEDIKFMVALDQPMQPKFAFTAAQLINTTFPAIFIAKQEDFEQLPSEISKRLTILVDGKIGHRRCVAFIITK